MEKEYECPFCHSHHIEVENEEYDKEQLRNQLEDIRNNPNPYMEGLKNMLEQLLAYNQYEDEAYLKRLEEHGLELICKDCRGIFYENDKYSEEEIEEFNNLTKIPFEEYKEIILDAVKDVCKGL